MMNTETLQQLAWDAEDSDEHVNVYYHESQSDVILYVEVNGETFENEYLSEELEPDDFYAERIWQE